MCLLAAPLRLLFLLHQLNQRSVAVGLRALAEENLLDHAWLWRPDRMLRRQKTQEVTSLETQHCVCTPAKRQESSVPHLHLHGYHDHQWVSHSHLISGLHQHLHTRTAVCSWGTFISNQYNKTKPMMSLRNKKEVTHSIMTSSLQRWELLLKSFSVCSYRISSSLIAPAASGFEGSSNTPRRAPIHVINKAEGFTITLQSSPVA